MDDYTILYLFLHGDGARLAPAVRAEAGKAERVAGRILLEPAEDQAARAPGQPVRNRPLRSRRIGEPESRSGDIHRGLRNRVRYQKTQHSKDSVHD